MVSRGGIRVLLTAALAGVAALCTPAAASAQIDGAPLNVMADGLGAIQIRQDGVADALFYDPELDPGHAGLEIKEGEAVYPLESGFDKAPGRTNVTPPTLSSDGTTHNLTSAYRIGPNLVVQENLSYTNGAPQVNVRYAIENVSAAPTSVRAGVLADLYVGGNDSSYGAIASTPPRFIGGREETTGLVYGLQEVTPWLAFQEGDFEAVFDNFAAAGLTNTVDSAAPDNGVGVEYALNLAPGATQAIDVRWLLASPAPPGTVTPTAPDGNGNPGAAAPLIEQLPPPVTGKTVNVSVRKGRIRIKIPPSKKFVELKGALQIPVGATIDARKGRVNLVSTTTGRGGETQLAWFYDGIFKVGQTRGAKPVTDLALAEPLARCPKAKGGKASAAAKKKKTRKLWGEGKGAFRTSGRHSSATVRGTKWLVTDRCDGTLTRVTQGSVLVRDFKRKRNVVVRAGKSYLARR